jgi:hypothetical protein
VVWPTRQARSGAPQPAHGDDPHARARIDGADADWGGVMVGSCETGSKK